MNWFEIKTRLLQLGFILCPSGKEQRGLLTVLEGIWTEAGIKFERESEVIKYATSEGLKYLSECVSGKERWFTND